MANLTFLVFAKPWTKTARVLFTQHDTPLCEQRGVEEMLKSCRTNLSDVDFAYKLVVPYVQRVKSVIRPASANTDVRLANICSDYILVGVNLWKSGILSEKKQQQKKTDLIWSVPGWSNCPYFVCDLGRVWLVLATLPSMSWAWTSVSKKEIDCWTDLSRITSQVNNSSTSWIWSVLLVTDTIHDLYW